MALDHQQQQELRDHIERSGLFGGKIDVTRVARILQIIGTAIAGLIGEQPLTSGGGQVSGGPGSAAARP